ncbi:hypothetical protein K6U66_12935 [Vibrio alginolyticus]|uniref:hypothetical protein n=1 Tax=Vibrio alginolyticus TaxID=663 RepID=UPI001EEA6781|nr:hypothetical protein [Vibrio alginolyticus]ELA7189545.1 hypothetical protein [Vibrio alginolyticus]MCG6318683.1 hypothetical protein [Vibrio alginolyticus]
MDLKRYGSVNLTKTQSLFEGVYLKSHSTKNYNDSQYGHAYWGSAVDKFIIGASNIPYRDGVTTHDYLLLLTVDDVTNVIDSITETLINSPNGELRKALRKKSDSIVSLLSAVYGFETTKVNKK